MADIQTLGTNLEATTRNTRVGVGTSDVARKYRTAANPPIPDLSEFDDAWGYTGGADIGEVVP